MGKKSVNSILDRTSVKLPGSDIEDKLPNGGVVHINIVRSFKLNKAQDVFGLSAEHLKNAPDELFPVLASLMNSILQTGHIPPQLKQGILTPVLKKKKDASLPTNYRGITVLSIVGKILERVLQNRTKYMMEAQQLKMQRGFTNNASAVNAALIISEAQNEAKDIGEPLKLVTLDACKAFDVVWQDSLLRKIHNGIQGKLWLCLSNLYKGAHSTVKWQGIVSPSFEIKQGVRQGGILSTLHYKLYNNDLLHLLESLRAGMSIGHIDCSCPTCADDVALLAKFLICLQILLGVVKFYISREHYFINAQKSAEVELSKVASCGKDDGMPTLVEDKIQRSVSEVHLGVDRSCSGSVDIDARVQMGRRTMYAMMGAGAYGSSGVAPMVIAHLWRVFALPRMLYGLETYCLRAKDVQQLEQLQRSIMKRVQCLPVGTATSAAYGLLGIRPIQQELDIRKLTLLGNVLQNKNTLEYEIVQRQLAVKSIESKSWFADCNRLLYKYNLPNIYHVIDNIESLEGWKVLIKKQIDSYVEKEWASDAKVSLQWLNMQSMRVGQVHQVWKFIPHEVRTIKRAYPKLRLLTGTYILQENRARFGGCSIRECCLLCGEGAETRVHFIAGCSRLEAVRVNFKAQLITILSRKNPLNVVNEVLSNPNRLVELILDCSVTVNRQTLKLDEDVIREVEQLSRNMCYSLHQKRCEILGLILRK